MFDIGQDDRAGDLSYTVGDWVIVRGVLMPATDPRAAHVGYGRYLPAIDVLQKMLQDERRWLGRWDCLGFNILLNSMSVQALPKDESSRLERTFESSAEHLGAIGGEPQCLWRYP